MFETIVEGTRRTLELRASSGATRFLLTSSGAVYGRQPPELAHVPEDYHRRARPDRSAPGRTREGKRAAEMLCAIYADEDCSRRSRGASRSSVRICRSTRSSPSGISSATGCRAARFGVAGDGTPHRSYLYARRSRGVALDDSVAGPAMRPYNVGSEAAITIADLARLIASRFTPFPRCGSRARRCGADGGSGTCPAPLGRAASSGLTATVGLESAIDRTVEWYGRALS